MDSERSRKLITVLAVLLALNLLGTIYLIRTVQDQNRRIEALERNDSIKQSVDKLNTKIDSIKDRVQSLFH